jgi:hypothetical protein
MIRQLLKPLLIPALILMSGTTCFGQFINDSKLGVKPKGKIDTIAVMQYGPDREDSTRHLSNKTINVYNKKGQIVESYYFSRPLNADAGPNDKDSRSSKSVFSYDNKGNIMEIMHYDILYKPSYKDTYVYSDSTLSGNMKCHFYKDRRYYSGLEPKSIEFKLNDSGNMIEAKSYRDTAGKDLRLIQNAIYNTKGYLVEVNTLPYYYDLRPDPPIKRLYSYDDKGDLLKQIIQTYHAVNHTVFYTITYIYTYPKFDKHHNWLVQNTYVNNKLEEVVERRITYYK